MKKLEDDKIRFSKTETIFIVGLPLVLISLIFIYARGISVNTIDDWLPDLGLVSFIGFIMNIKWRIFNKSLNKKAVFFGIFANNIIIGTVYYAWHSCFFKRV